MRWVLVEGVGAVGLELDQLAVETVRRDELLVGAGLRDAAPLEHDDPVRPPDRGETVGDHEDRAAPQQRFDRVLHEAFALRVEGARRLVEDQDLRVAQDRSSDGDALTLAAREARARDPHFGLVALGQGLRELVHVRGVGRGAQLVFRRPGARIPDVVRNRSVEEEWFLAHDGHVCQQGISVDIAEIDAVDLDGAARGVVEAQQQVGVTNTGGLPEIVPHGKVGYVVEPEPKEIAEAIIKFYSEGKEEEFTTNAKAEKERFSWSAFVSGLEKLASGL